MRLQGAHARDLELQGKYGVNYQHYWVDEEDGKVFCLVEAPDAETAARVHREAHGNVADDMIPSHREPRPGAATSPSCGRGLRDGSGVS